MYEETQRHDGEEIEYGFGQFASPGAISHQLQGELVACWRCLPTDGRTPEAAIDDARAAFARATEWWRSLGTYTTEAIAMALHRDLDPPDVDNMAVELTAEAYDSLQKYNRDSSVRQAIFTCWCLLPEARRAPEQVSRIMASLFDRTIANFRDDAQVFSG